MYVKRSSLVTDLQGEPSQSTRIAHLAPQEAEQGTDRALTQTRNVGKWKDSHTIQKEHCPGREVVKKVKAQMEIKLARGVKSNEKGFYSYKD